MSLIKSERRVLGGTPATPIEQAAIVTVGVKVTGVVQHVAPIGQLDARHPAAQAEESVVRVVYAYSDGLGTSYHADAMLCVPAGKAKYLVPGNPIPVSFVPGDPEQATIDWSRLA